MTNRQRLTLVMVVATLTTLLPVVAYADSVSARMGVSVQVVARALLTVDSAPSNVTVTAQDVARGYVELEAPIRVQVRSNSQRGYLLRVARLNDAFGSINLDFAGGSVRVTGDESWIARPALSLSDSLELRGRVALRSGVEPGQYPLPFELSASPL